MLALDIGSENIHMCEGIVKAGVVEVTGAAEKRRPVTQASGGTSKNQAAVISTIESLVSEKPFKAGKTAVTFAGSSVYSRKLTLPNAKPAELYAMVRNEMLQVVSDIGDTAVDYACVKPSADKTAPLDIWAYAVSKEIIEEYHDLFRNLKLKPAALDIHANSIDKLFCGSTVNGVPLDGRAVLFGDIGAENVDIHLFGGHGREFSRISPLSASDFENILGNLGYRGNMSAMESIDISPASLKGDQMLSDASANYFGRLSDEFQKMIQFQLRRDSLHPVAGVYLYGGVSQVRGIAEYLTSSLGLEVQVVSSVSSVRFPQNLPLAKYINAAGALIRQ